MRSHLPPSKALSVLALVAMTSLAITTTSYAMGSGDKFVDAQTGLTFAVHKPTQTLGLKLSRFQLIVCAPGKEQWVYAKYGTGKKFLEIMETMAGDKCSNPGLSKSLTSIVINKFRAQVHVYCDPTQPAAFKKCSASDISKVGGYLMFTTKPTKSLKATEIQVQGMGGVTYSQLILVAKNLKPL